MALLLLAGLTWVAACAAAFWAGVELARLDAEARRLIARFTPFALPPDRP